MYIRVFSYSLLRSNQADRRSALQSWKKIISTRRIGSLSEQLVDALKATLVKLKAADVPEKTAESVSQRSQNFSKNAITVLTQLIGMYVELDFSAADKGRLIVECLLISGEPGIGKKHEMINFLNFSIEKFFENFFEKFF